MTYRQAMKDERIWKRMGQELAIIGRLVDEVLCDTEYNSVMDKKTWGKWYAIANHISKIRSEADSRAYQYCPQFDPDWFYGGPFNPALSLAEKTHQDMKEGSKNEPKGSTRQNI